MKIDRRFPPCWSAAKDGLYWNEWKAVQKADPRADRHALHIKALGADKSHVDFTNADFDKVLGVFRAISKPDDLFSQLHAIDGRKRRLIFGIRRTAGKMKVSDAYVAAIAETQLGRRADLDDLTEDELEDVRIALSKQLVRNKRAEKEELQPA